MNRYETNRLVLRRIDVSETNLLLDYLQRNKNFLKEWEPLRDESYYLNESIKNTIENENISFKDKNSLCLYIFNKNEGKIIGNVSLIDNIMLRYAQGFAKANTSCQTWHVLSDRCG